MLADCAFEPRSVLAANVFNSFYILFNIIWITIFYLI
jgi:hypothetical protein